MLRVFLSSTGRDLHKCRSLVYQAVEGLDGYHCVRMEDFGAWNEAPADLCRRRVAECDLFVILAGPLYGTIVPGGPSYTEFEYDIAQETQKPCLIFLTSEAFLIPANLVEPVTTKRKQDVFRKKIGSRVQAMFSTCTELPGKVLQAIHNWETTPAEHSVIRIHPISPNGDAREFRRPFLRFGRNPEAEVLIKNDPTVSWEHGMMFKHEGRFYYRHLSAINATRLTTDDRKILLRPGDQEEICLGSRNELRIGNTTLEVDVILSVNQPKCVPTDPEEVE